MKKIEKSMECYPNYTKCVKSKQFIFSKYVQNESNK